MSFVDGLTEWDISTRRKEHHYAFSHEEEGKNIQPADRIPEDLVPIMGCCQPFLTEYTFEENRESVQ